jgi:hypothetical protein
MNTKVVYSAGIAILLIGLVFYFVNSGYFTSEKPISSSLNSSKTISKTSKPISYQSASSVSKSNIVGSTQQQQSSPLNKQISSNYENLTVSAKTVDVVPSNNVSYLQIALNVHNPNKGAAILETLSYNVYIHNIRLVSADIGSAPQGFIDSSSSVYPIIGNQTITLKDRHPITPEGSSLFNSNGTLINSNSTISKDSLKPNSFIINGTFSTTLDRGIQSQYSENPFNLKFPIK